MFFWKYIRMYFGRIVIMIMVNNGVQAWTYHYTTGTDMGWEMGRQWCRQHYTDMVAIQNQEEITYLDHMLPFHRSYYWIGLRKMDDQWMWVGTLKALAPKAENWATGEPNNQGTNEDCVEIYIKRSKDAGKWNDDKCNKKKAVLCYSASCFERSCSEHAECVEIIGNYTCKCEPGFTGPRCDEAVDCGRVKTPEQGFVQCDHVYGNFRFNTSCHFHCAPGYTLQGAKHLHCLSFGKWDSEPPECQVVECPPIATRSGGWNMSCIHPLQTNSYKSTCVFSCDEGFELRGSHTTRCDHTGQWTHNTTPNCTAVTCDLLVSPEKGNMTCSAPLGEFSFRSLCTVTCEEGHTLRGENTLTCLNTGNWSAETPVCEVRRCSTLSSAPHGYMRCTDLLEKFAYGSICGFECDIRFLLMGSKYTYCNAQGMWTHSLPVCRAVQCSPLSAHSSAVRMNCTHPISTNSYSSSCVFHCDEGFNLTGSYKTQCDHTGQWTPKPPTCRAVTCDLLVSPENGNLTCSAPLGEFSFQSSCTVICEEGHTLRGQNTLTCRKTGKWSAETPVCEAVQCSPLSAHSSAVRMNCTHPISTNSYSSSCVFHCDEGFNLTGSYKTQCDHTGQWTPKPPTCRAVTCEHIVTPEKGNMTCSAPLGEFSFRSSCTVTCEEGHLLRGENTLNCLKTGHWSAETPVCEARQCPLLSSPENGWMNCSHSHTLFRYGSRCSYGCEIGFMLRGESELDCTSAGNWSEEIPSCNVVQCDSLLHAPLSQSDSTPVPFMNCSHPRGNFSFGSRCVLRCPEGYRLNGSTALICTSYGLWTDLLPTCIIKDIPLGTALLVYGAVGAASSLGLLLIIGLVILWRQKFGNNKFTPDYAAWDGTPNPVFEDN